MNENESAQPQPRHSRLKVYSIFAVILIAAFLLGMVPMWLKVRSVNKELAASQTQIRKQEVAGLLTTSIVEARRGEYEIARQATSDFFTRLRAEEDMGDAGFLTAEQRAKAKPVFEDRDAVITMLAQRDPASLDRLTNIYVNYRALVPAVAPTTLPPSSNANVPAR